MFKRIISVIMTVCMCTVGVISLPARAVAAEFTTEPMIAAGLLHTVALKNDGSVWTWGDNGDGQLGNGSEAYSTTPARVNIDNVAAVAAGVDHTLALKKDGSLWAWGCNESGQLGEVTTTDSITPVKVNIENVAAVSAGLFHTVALKKDGSLWAWGCNESGQLGEVSDTDSTTPVRVNIDNVAAVSAGWNCTVALKNDGSVWTWGDNCNGQLGNGSEAYSTTPVRVNIDNVAAVSAGSRHTVALKNDGSLWAWGYNEYGQLGDGSTTDRYTPVRVNIDNVAAVWVGGFHTVALKKDGSLWAWGWNELGQLGEVTTTDRTTPVRVNIDNVVAVAAGVYDTLALKKDGSLWAWGDNGYGQLGNGTTTKSAVPVKVKNSDGTPFNLGAPTSTPTTPVVPEVPYADNTDEIYKSLEDIPSVSDYNITNKETAVSAVEKTVDLIKTKKIDMNDDLVKSEIANFADAAISLSAQKSLDSEGVIDTKTVSDLAKQTAETQKAVEAALKAKNIDLGRDTLLSVTLKADKGVKLSKDLKTLPVDSVNVAVGNNASIVLTKQFVEDMAAEGGEPLELSFTADNSTGAAAIISSDGKEVAASTAKKGTFAINKKITTPVTLELGLIDGVAPTYQGVRGASGLTVSMPNRANRTIKFRATESGKYAVTNVTKLDFADINSLSIAQKDTLRRLYAHGLVNGKSAASFAPTTTLTRAEFATLLIKTIGAYDATYSKSSGFVDMKGLWAEPVVSKAKELGIIAGYESDNTFRPDNKLNNEQLYHLLGLTYTKNNRRAANVNMNVLNKFGDKSAISPWASKNFTVSVASGIHAGTQGSNVLPKNEVTRLNASFAVGKLFERSCFDGNWR